MLWQLMDIRLKFVASATFTFTPHPGKTETKPYECRYSILQAALKLWGIFTHV